MPRMTGARLFAEMMQGYGVSHIFFGSGLHAARRVRQPIRVAFPICTGYF